MRFFFYTIRKNTLKRIFHPLIVTVVISAAGPAHESTQKGNRVETTPLIQDLGSPFFIVRDRAGKKVREMNTKAVPLLLEGLENSDPLVRRNCITLLNDIIPHTLINDRIEVFLDQSDQAAALEAVRFLAAHPIPGEKEYKRWVRDTLSKGTTSIRSAFLSGIRWPALPCQTGLIVEALPELPSRLRPVAIRALSKGERADAALRLKECFLLIRKGLLEEHHLPVLLESLEDCVTPDSIDVIAQCIPATSLLVGEKAWKALSALRIHLFRLRDFEGLISLNKTLCRLFPEETEYTLDLADSILLYRKDPIEAVTLLEKLKNRLEGNSSTKSVLQLTEAHQGLAIAAFRAGGDWKPHLQTLPAGLEKTPGDYCAWGLARAILLRGTLLAVEGENAVTVLEQAVDIAPFEQDKVAIDSCLSGRFGVSGLLWRLSRDGRLHRCHVVHSQLIAAVRKDKSRARSRIPFDSAAFTRYDYGEPAFAARLLRTFIKRVEESGVWNSLDLAGQACFVLGAAEMDIRDFARARDSIGKGIRIYEGLLAEYRAESKKNPREAFDDLIRTANRRKALGLLQMATLNTIEEKDASLAGEDASLAREDASLTGEDASPKTAGLVRAAAFLAPELVEVRMARALVLARAGQAVPAERIANAVEEYAEQYYNKACLFALIGKKDKAFKYLSRHFGEHVRPARMHLARNYALADPDLAALRQNRRFLELVGAVK